MSFILNLLQSLLYGFVMGITSWLPISPAAHMTLMKSFLPLQIYNDYLSNLAFWNLFRSLIQIGGMLAVMLLFWGRLNPWQKGIRAKRKRKIIRLWLMILISVIPALILEILLDDLILTKLSTGWALAAALILFGGFMFWSQLKENKVRVETVNQVRATDAVRLSLFRFLSLLPGIGHTDSTMVTAELLGFSRETAAEYAYMLTIPTVLGSVILRAVSFVNAQVPFSLEGLAAVLAGMAVCFVTSLFVIRYMLNYVRRHDLKIFSLYRVVLGILVVIFTLFKVIS